MAIEPTLLSTLRKIFSTREISLDEKQASSLAGYLTLLEKWNRNIRLTGVRGSMEIATRLLPGTLDFLKIWKPSKGDTVLDVGAGSGIVGIPMGILFRAIHVCMVESNDRKAAFLGEATRCCGGTNLAVICGRAESLSGKMKDNTENYSVILARAVAPLGDLLPMVWPLLAQNGALLVRQGKKGEAELRGAGTALASHRAIITMRREVEGGAVVKVERADKPRL